MNEDPLGSPTYNFDNDQSGHSTVFLDEHGDKVGYLREPIFPPVGSDVKLHGGAMATVTKVWLDISNDSELAMVYISVKTPKPGVFHQF